MSVQYAIPEYVHISQDCRQLLSQIFVSKPAKVLHDLIEPLFINNSSMILLYNCLELFIFSIWQRITIREIRNHPWFLKNLPRELTEPVQAVYYKQDIGAPTYSLQSVDEIMKIIEEAKEALHLSTRLSGIGFIEEGEEEENQQGNKEEEEEVEEDEYDKTVREVHASGEYPIMWCALEGKVSWELD